MRTLIVLLLLLLGAAPAAAQTHPCDEPDVFTGTAISGMQLYAYWCSYANENIEAATIYVNTSPFYLASIDIVEGTPNGDGQIQYRALIGSFSRGTYNIELSTWNRNETGDPQEGTRSSPFSLLVADRVVIPAPGAPRLKKVSP